MTLNDTYARRSRPRQTTLDLGVVIGTSLLLAVSAKVQVPFFPVPMTMQTLVVFGISLTLGPVRGTLAVLTYLLEGVAGLPVFAGSPEKGVGLAYLMGPTGGYLTGCLPAVLLSGWLAKRGWDRSFLSLMATGGIALTIIYGSGLIWLGTVIGFDKSLLRLGFFPFVVADLVKVTVVALAFHSARNWLQGSRRN